MKQRCARFIALISHALPDLSRVPQRRQILGGLLASVVLHLVIVGLLIFFGARAVQERELARLAEVQPPPLREVEVQLMPPSPPAIPSEPAVFDANGLEKAAAAPDRPVFQSSQDMVAGSALPGKGAAPIPTQEGIKHPTGDFKDQAAVLAREAAEEAREKSRAQKAVQASQPAAPPPAAEPLSPIAPEPRPERDSGKKIALYPKKTEPRQEVAMLTPPKPRATEPPREARPEVNVAPGSQPEMRKSEMEGSISNRGRPGVDAVKTPLGVYRKKLSAQIHARWQFYTKQRMDTLSLGTVKVRFFVTPEGRVENVSVVESNSNSTFANICEQSVREAEVPAPPSDLEAMKDGRLEMIFSFTLY